MSTRAFLRLIILLFCAPLCPGLLAASPTSAAAPERSILVGYFGQWSLYNQQPYTVKKLVQSGAAAMLDQLSYAQGFVTGGHCSVADPNADLNYTFTAETSVDGSADSPSLPFRGNFHQLLELKRLYPRLKILISLEGRASDFAADAEREQRAAFVSSCVDLFLKGHFGPQASAPGLFDGIDIDWEFPRGEASENYLPLLQEFRRQMNLVRPGLLLTVALGPSPRMYGDADLSAIGQLVDRAGLMTYDFNGPWSSTTGLIAPLSSTSPEDGSVERSVMAWKSAGFPSAKLLIGLPFYGYGWRQVGNEDHGLGQDGMPIRGDYPYREIQKMIAAAEAQSQPVNSQVPKSTDSRPPAEDLHPLATKSADSEVRRNKAPSEPSPEPRALVYRDSVSQAPWLFDGSSFWTYEDPTSIRAKASYAASQKLAGFMVWELSDDTADATLLKAARTALLHPPTGQQHVRNRIRNTP